MGLDNIIIIIIIIMIVDDPVPFDSGIRGLFIEISVSVLPPFIRACLSVCLSVYTRLLFATWSRSVCMPPPPATYHQKRTGRTGPSRSRRSRRRRRKSDVISHVSQGKMLPASVGICGWTDADAIRRRRAARWYIIMELGSAERGSQQYNMSFSTKILRIFFFVVVSKSKTTTTTTTTTATEWLCGVFLRNPKETRPVQPEALFWPRWPLLICCSLAGRGCFVFWRRPRRLRALRSVLFCSSVHRLTVVVIIM